MSRLLVGLACAVLFTSGAVAFVLKPKPVAIAWRPSLTNMPMKRPVVPSGASFAPCEPMLEALGHFTTSPPQVVFTPGLATRAACAVLRVEAAADAAWFAVTGRAGTGMPLHSLRESVVRSLSKG